MSRRDALRRRAEELAAAYQDADVIPHCARCAKPCCRLDPLVLELDWTQIRVLWRIEDSRRTFDRLLASGKGPAEIRTADGVYFAHGKVCPAYDEGGKSCKVYGQALKPSGCSDFPVYENGGDIVADLRCEAVDLEALAARVSQSFGRAFRISRSANKDFPFLVTLSVRKAGSTD
jgi:Fe-S-cluster containining protein